MNAVAGERYAGLCRFECRRRVWEDMQRDGTAIRKVILRNLKYQVAIQAIRTNTVSFVLLYMYMCVC